MKHIAFSIAWLLCGAAQAHVTLAPAAAVAGAYARVVLQVPHGCAGSATTAITVTLPDGFIAAKPMPKPGWQLSLQRARQAQPLSLHGRALEETTASVSWEGGRLPNEFFDEFVLFGQLSAEPGERVFRVLQVCEKGQVNWDGPAGSDTPAPVLRVAPAAAGEHAHH